MEFTQLELCIPLLQFLVPLFPEEQDWKPLRFPSLLWLGDNKRATLVQQLTRSICAMDGSVALDICGRLLRPEGFIPVGRSVDYNY